MHEERIERLTLIRNHMDFQAISEWFRNENFFNDQTTNIRIPSALINEENKLLEENVETKVKELVSLQLDIVENADRIKMLEDNQKLVQDEIDSIQVCIFSYLSVFFFAIYDRTFY